MRFVLAVLVFVVCARSQVTKYALTIRLTPDQIDDILDLGQSITLVKSVGGLTPAAWHVIPPTELAEKITVTWEER